MRDREQRLRILIVAAHYPPSSAAAAIRARNIVRNLQSLGHEVQVITARSAQRSELPREAIAVPWLDLEHAAKRVLGGRTQRAEAAPVRAPGWQKNLRTLAARLIVPDLHALWIPPATAMAFRIARASDAVLSTGAASAHLVARLVHRGRPWIADVNDLWWRNPHRNVGVFREGIDLRIERSIIGSPTALTVPNDALGAEIRTRFGRSPRTILTGFDLCEFEVPRNPARTSAREIIFAGTLYADFPLSVLLEALANGRDRRRWSSSTLRVVFIGTSAAEALSEARRHGVGEFVDAVPPMPRQDLLKRLGEADALLFPLYPSDPYHLPMRFFDFVGSGRPMIGVGSGSAPAAEMIERHALGFVCSTIDELVSVLDNLTQNGRPADLPLQNRRLFELGCSRPHLQEVLDQAAVDAG
jgi:hypothetical protein